MLGRLLPSLVLIGVLAGCARRGHGGSAAVDYARPGAPRPGSSGARIQGGAACLDWLAGAGVRFQVLEPMGDMPTPVSIQSPLGGVDFVIEGRRGLVCDCRLAAVLQFLGPEFRRQSISQVHHSGAYVDRTTRRGRQSLHAMGLAIDVHRLVVHGQLLQVERDFLTGQSCDEWPAVLLAERGSAATTAVNRFVCDLRRTDLFQELLTPDDDRDHHDHVHLGIGRYVPS